VGSEGHGVYLREALEDKTEVLGVIPFTEALSFNERHLGLQASQELTLPGQEKLAALAEQMLDMDQIIKIGQLSPTKKKSAVSRDDAQEEKVSILKRYRVAIAKDEAFHFYYPSNLQYLQKQGVELVAFSPLHSAGLPDDIEGLILGGGFPEEYARDLSANDSMRNAIKNALEGGLPCYAECGGFMYLAESVCLPDALPMPMVGMIPGKIQMTPRLQHFGYSICQREGEQHQQKSGIRGHEFHYSRWEGEEAYANLWRVTKHRTGKSRMEGYHKKNLWASYVHVYWASCPECMEPFLKTVLHFKATLSMSKK
ncbi:MAG: cobyrinate a,c-diamide synthase, partial [Verrucomicrobiota bacterium]